MGFLGGRFTHAPQRERKLHGALDGEVGVGMGAGGSDDCPTQERSCDGRRWNQRVAFGSYLGGGAGYHFSWFALYARGRIQQTVSDGLPATLWGTLHGGIQFRIARTVDLFAGTGLSGFVNSHRQNSNFWSSDAGISVHFDVSGRRKRTQARRGVRLRM